MIFLILLVAGFVAGIAFATNSRKGSVQIAVGVAILGIIIALVFSCIRVVPAGYVGIIDLFGQVADKHLESGINFVNPLANVRMLSVRTQEDMEVMPVPSREGLTINLDISMLYRLDPGRAANIYKTVGMNYKDVVLNPQFRAAARGVTVAHDAKALYTSEREVLAQAIFDSLKSLVGDRGIIIERVLLRGMALPQSVGQAIEQKLRSEQDAERMKFVLQKETLEAERKRVEAAGIRDAQTIINQSLTSQYLQYLWINTLNENPNVIYVATEANMPLFRAIDPDEENRNKKPLVQKEQR